MYAGDHCEKYIASILKRQNKHLTDIEAVRRLLIWKKLQEMKFSCLFQLKNIYF